MIEVASPPVLPRRRRAPLLEQLGWVIGMRWLAATLVIAGAVIDLRWLGWYRPHSAQILAVGIGILVYNALLWWTLERVSLRRGSPRRLVVPLAWAQLLLDMSCL